LVGIASKEMWLMTTAEQLMVYKEIKIFPVSAERKNESLSLQMAGTGCGVNPVQYTFS
jgi:hypothetical protein